MRNYLCVICVLLHATLDRILSYMQIQVKPGSALLEADSMLSVRERRGSMSKAFLSVLSALRL
jgi:hypothetical protein